LPTDRPRIVRDVTNLLVRLEPAPVVARVQITLSRLRDQASAETEIAAARFLASAGAPVAPPADGIDPGPHVQGGHLVTLWRWIDHDPDRADPPSAGRALRELHDAFTGFEGGLPTCDRLDEVRRLLATFSPSSEVDELRALAERLSPVDGVPLHGDAHLRNVLWSPQGPLWSDLENICRGPVEYDLACLRFRASPASEAAIEAYGGHDPAAVEAVMPHLTLFLAAWTRVVADRAGTDGAHAEARRRVERALRYARLM
jgi:Ser/Thr protein kinase RdoA (MazF antagonist)